MSSLLDIFAIGFNSEGIKDFEKNLKTTESELDKAEKKVAKLEKQLDELEKSSEKDADAIQDVKVSLEQAKSEVVKFSDEIKTMQGTSEFQLTKLKKNFHSIVKSLGLIATVGVAVRQSLQFYEQAEQLDFLAQKTNIAIDSLQRLGNATQRYGGSTESSASTIEQFTTKEFKEKSLKYGISIDKNSPEQTLENIAKKMEQLKTNAEKWELSKNLGLDEGTTRLLIEGVQRYREELKRADKYKLYTKEDIERMRDFRQVQQDIRYGIQNIQAVVAKLLLPALTFIAKALKSVTDWAVKHEGGVKIAAIFITIATGIGIASLAIKNLNIALKFLMANPVVLTVMAWAAAITFLIVVIQDFIGFLKGENSVIGEILKKLGFDVDKVRENCLNTFKSIENWVKNVINWFIQLGGKIGEFASKVKAMWDSLPEPIKKLIGLANPLTAAFTITNLGKDMVEQANSNQLNSVPQGAVQTINQTEALTNNNNKNMQSFIKTNNKSINVNIGQINTQASDGNQLAKELTTITDLDNGLIA